MGTRGLWGYVIEGEDKFAYNHFDSYPSGLGGDLLRHTKAMPLEQLREQAKALKMVDEDEPPTALDVEMLREFADEQVSGQDMTREWYVLLRGCQGDPDKTLGSGYMLDGAGFQNDSLFCEWAYVIDLDEGVFEVYRGFQREPHTDGRFVKAELEDNGHRRRQGEDECYRCGAKMEDGRFAEVCSEAYFPVRLTARFPLDDLPDDLDAVEKAVYAEDEEEEARAS